MAGKFLDAARANGSPDIIKDFRDEVHLFRSTSRFPDEAYI
jgi:hypothetical protein